MDEIHRLNYTQLKMMTKEAGITKPGRSKENIIDYINAMDAGAKTEFASHVQNVLVRQDKMSKEKITFEHDCGHSDGFDADLVDEEDEDKYEADTNIVKAKLTLNRNQLLAYLSLNGLSLDGDCAALVDRFVSHAFRNP
jgi:hypothetical protein